MAVEASQYIAVPAIEARGLTKIYKDFWGRPKVRAVADLDLVVDRGEVFGLLGPNGSGKTTTINMCLGLLFPTRGELSVLGESPRSVRAKRRIGFLPEESYLYRFLNAEETLDLYGRLFNLPLGERRRRTEALLGQLGMREAGRRLLKEYSKGMARRIGMAQALINDPDLVFLDEPTSGLDPAGSREIKDIILKLRDAGKTVVLSTHLLADVEDVCDRIAILYRGRLLKAGAVKEMLSVKDLLQMTLKNVPDAGVRALKEAVERLGGEVVSSEHPTERLETLFLRIVEEAGSRDADPGRS